jgi:hypothetical protein
MSRRQSSVGPLFEKAAAGWARSGSSRRGGARNRPTKLLPPGAPVPIAGMTKTTAVAAGAGVRWQGPSWESSHRMIRRGLVAREAALRVLHEPPQRARRAADAGPSVNNADATNGGVWLRTESDRFRNRNSGFRSRQDNLFVGRCSRKLCHWKQRGDGLPLDAMVEAGDRDCIILGP